MALRHLNPGEVKLAFRVFKDSLPWARIHLAPHYGLNESYYTMGRTINVGPDFFSEGMDGGGFPSWLLIHELTHVWQYEHRSYSGSYIFDSLFARATKGEKEAYKYTPGKAWDKYSAEQQASIVADWWLHGCDVADQNYRYVRDVIRTKHMKPDVSEWSKTPALFESARSGW